MEVDTAHLLMLSNFPLRRGCPRNSQRSATSSSQTQHCSICVLHEEIPHGDGRRRLVIVVPDVPVLIQLYFLKPFYFEEHYLLQPHLTPAFTMAPQISIGVMQLAYASVLCNPSDHAGERAWRSA